MVLILFAALLSIGQTDSTEIKEGNIFIYEYSAKIYGQASIGFAIVNDSIVVQDLGYKIYYDAQQIKKIKRTVTEKRYSYTKKINGNIFIDKLKKLCYNNKNYKLNMIYPVDFYKLLSLNFEKISNKERLYLIEKIIKDKN